MAIIEKKIFNDIQLSVSKLVKKNKYIDCQFENCNLSNYIFTNCEFEECIFTNCNFSNSFLAMNKGVESGSFLNCLFIVCNLAETSFRFPLINKCEFRNCILKETNFDGSRFSETKFVGLLDSCFFRGYSVYSTSNTLFSFSKFDPLKFPNQMMNVDFSSSKLVGVSFINRIDLSNCIFPKGDEYVYLPDLKGTIKKAIEIINSSWTEGYEKETGLKLVNNLYYNKDRQEQQSDFIDSFCINEVAGVEDDECVGIKFFKLMKLMQ